MAVAKTSGVCRTRRASSGAVRRASAGQGAFARKLASWYKKAGRDFPWRSATDPFAIAVAEILLRKTRAADVLPVYARLLLRYPTARAMAGARPSALRRLIDPLGLRSRAEMLVALSRSLVRQHSGAVPADEALLRRLPGIGRYAASAILCFGFGRPRAIVDSSIGRLVRRLRGIDARGPAYLDERLWRAAAAMLPKSRHRAKLHNYAMLDLAALVCTRAHPECRTCPVGAYCRGYRGRTT